MAEYLTQNFNGADLTLANNDVIAGALSGINKFTIPNDVTVYVKTYTVTPSPAHGTVEVQALKILIEPRGVLNASGRGFGGGNAGSNSAAGYAGGGMCTSPSTRAGNYMQGGVGGGGSLGGAASGYGGDSTGTNWAGTGAAGGNARNEDLDTSLVALKGAGGAGGNMGGSNFTSGYTSFLACGGGGGAGQQGGGAVIFKANVIIIWGSIVSGTRSAGDGGSYVGGAWSYNGGSAASAGSSLGSTLFGAYVRGGGNGGTAAGGGILLQFVNRMSQVTAFPKVYVPGTIDTRGGGDTTNGGTMKVYSPTSSVTGMISTRISGIKYISAPPSGCMASA